MPSFTFNISDIPSQSGKIVLVTGGNAGLGFEIAAQLLAKGAQVIIAGRSQARIDEAVNRLGNGASGELVDLASFSSITSFSERVKAKYSRIDILVDNAGISLPTFGKTPEGFEKTLGTNAIGTALLTHLLLPLVIASPIGRIIVLSSAASFTTPGGKPWRRLKDVGGEKESTSTMDHYADSKLLNALWAEELSSRLRSNASTKHILVASVHPGVVQTEIWEKADTSTSCLASFLICCLPRCMGIPVSTGALSTLFLCTADATKIAVGKLYDSGPRIRQMPLEKYKHYFPVEAFNAIDKAIQSKSGPAFTLPIDSR